MELSDKSESFFKKQYQRKKNKSTPINTESSKDFEALSTLDCEVIDSENPSPPKRRNAIFKTRTSPNGLFNLVQNLSNQQKEAVKEIGFGSLLTLGISKCPALFSKHIVSNFDVNKRSLVLNNGDEIKIDEELVQCMLNIPKGEIEIVESLGNDSKDYVYKEFLINWRRRWGLDKNKGAPNTNAMPRIIIDNKSGDDNFKIDFVVYVVSSFIWTTQNTQSRFKLLKSLMDVDNIKNLNWCKFTINGLIESVEKWKNNNQSYFDGPLTFLLLCYLDGVIENRVKQPYQRSIPIISCWNDIKMSERISVESRGGGFGLGRAITRLPLLEEDNPKIMDSDSTNNNKKILTSKVVEAFKNMTDAAQQLIDLSNEFEKQNMDAKHIFEAGMNNSSLKYFYNKYFNKEPIVESDDVNEINEDITNRSPIAESDGVNNVIEDITNRTPIAQSDDEYNVNEDIVMEDITNQSPSDKCGRVVDSREENEWNVDDPSKKRKYNAKKMEFIGWGSKQLIEFLVSLGKDTSQKMSQNEVTSVIMEYVNNNNLYHPQKKRKILCDEKLHSLFGKKYLARIYMVYDLLEPHYADNEEDWDSFFSNSDENGKKNSAPAVKRHKPSSSKQRCPETPKSCFAAIVPSNIKLVYLKKNLIVELLKNPETFEAKVIGSFVRVKVDPMDIIAKHSYQIQQVIGVKMRTRLGDVVTETLLEVPNVMKQINLSMLSSDNFTEEECNDLRERVKNGSIKKPTVVEFEEKIQQLHKDITKHWIKNELSMLQNLIDQANEKGWRKELIEYLDRRDLLDKVSEQTRLLTEIPKVIIEELELEKTPQEGSLVRYVEVNKTVSNHNDGAGQNKKEQHANEESSHGKDNQVLDGHADTWAEAAHSDIVMVDFEYYKEDSHSNAETSKDNNTVENQTTEGVPSILPDSNDNQNSGDTTRREVVELINDDDDRDMETDETPEDEVWHYLDLQGVVQGPFSLVSLKLWYDFNYFPLNFMIWKTGENRSQAVLLVDVIRRVFTSK